MKFAVVSLLLLLWLIPVQAQLPVAESSRLSSTDARIGVLTSGDNGITIEVGGLEPRIATRGSRSTVTTNAIRYTVADSASLPTLVFEVAVPYGVDHFTATLAPLSAALSRPLALPAGLVASPAGVTVGIPVIRRGFRVLPVYYRPFTLEGGALAGPRDSRISIGWRGSASAGSGAREYSESKAMESILAGSILNFGAARRWYRATARPAVGIMSASGWGIGEAVVLSVPANGIYRIGAEELEAAGARGIIGAPVASISLTNRRRPTPIFMIDGGTLGTFDRGDAIEFKGERLTSDEGIYLNDVTDTNAYILKWDASALSPAIRPASPSGAPVAMQSYDSTLHFEVENEYFGGYKSPDPEFGGTGDVMGVHVSERVPGERYYAHRVLNRDDWRMPFECSPVYEPGGTVTMQIRFTGNTDSKHRVEVVLNDNGAAGIAEFYGQIDTTFTFTFPTSLLLAGRNELRLLSLETEAFPLQWTMFDYFTLRGRWQTSALKGEVPRVTIAPGAPSPQRIELTGLEAPLTTVNSGRSRAVVESNERGFLYKLSSRQLTNRIMPSFVLQGDTFTVQSGPYSGGVVFAEIDPATGRLIRSLAARTHEQPQTAYGEALAFVRSVGEGNLLLAGFSIGYGDGVGADAVELRAALKALGSKVMDRSDWQVASWAFGVIKGKPEGARERYASIVDNAVGVTLYWFQPAAAGSTYRATVTVDGEPGEEFQFDTPKAPTPRYHPSDMLTGPENRADLLIVSHPKFIAQSNQLAAYRSSANRLAARVVDVYTIYDEFNDGIKSPDAIRRFLQYADTNWTAPKPAFVLLFGDGTNDPMKRLTESIMDDYIPTSGIPSSDYIYTVAVGDTTMAWRQLIGRLPAITTDDAQAMVDKLIEYDTLPPAQWNKRFVFLAGGGSAKEVRDNVGFYRDVMRDYIASPFFEGDTALVERTSPNPELPDAIDAERARGEINKGALWVSFSGHGSTNLVDLDFGYPEDLDIGNRYFVLGTFSCRTGDYAVSGVKPRNEYFMTAPHAGAVASIGATGYSYIDMNERIEVDMYSAITSPPYQTNIGAIFTNAKKSMYDLYFNGSGPGTYEGTRARNHLMMYSLLGDPSMDLVLSREIELALPRERAMIVNSSGEEPTPADSIAVVDAQIWNYGRIMQPDDSVTVVATIINPKQEESTDTITIGSIHRFSDLSFHLPLLRQPGEYTVRIEADPDHRITETDRDDNVLVLTLLVRGNQPLPIEPVPYGRVASYDDVVIHLLNPPSGPGADIIVDTTASFSSPSVISSRTTGDVEKAELTTTWTFTIPAEWRSAKTFWYKAIATSGDPEAAALFPLVESFTVDAATPAEFVLAGREQREALQLVNLVNTDRGVGPGSRLVPIELISRGQSTYNNGARILVVRSDIRIGGQNAFDGYSAGINILVLPSDNVTPIARGGFAFYIGAPEINRFLSFVADSIHVGDRVLLIANGISFDALLPGEQFRDTVIKALESIGAREASELQRDDSYALIGGKNLPPSMVRSQRVAAQPLREQGLEPPFPAVVRDTFSAVSRAGSFATPSIGPATAWRSLRLGLTSGTPPDVTIFGVRRDGIRDSLMFLTGADRIDLGGVDVRLYPRLELRANFDNDSTQRVDAIDVDYDPSPELALVPTSIRLEADSVLQGDPGRLAYAIANLSRRYDANDFAIRLSSSGNDQSTPIDSIHVARLPAGTRLDTAFTINTSRMTGENRFSILANTADVPAEPYRQNNVLTSSLLRVGLDVSSPSVAVYADGHRLMSGDFVSPTAAFEVRIYDNSRLKLDSTAVRKLIFDNDVIQAGLPGTRFLEAGEKEHKGSFFYKPVEELPSGEHQIKVFSVDATGNSDTSEIIVFYVERELRLAQVVNMPNPFAERTVFTFMVGGGSVPSGGEISIFTLAGRKIRSIPLSPVDLRIGFNRVEWNGLDEDGDRLANGVYFYRVRVDDGENRQEVLEKLVIMR
jgi:hypothetical protein